MVQPKLCVDCPEAAVREWAEELTVQRSEEGGLCTFMDTTSAEDKRWRPLQVDED